MKHKLAKTLFLSASLMAAGALTSLAGFVETADGVKYQWGDGSYCVNNRVHYRDHWYDFASYHFTENGVTGTKPYVNDSWDSNGNLIKGSRNSVR